MSLAPSTCVEAMGPWLTPNGSSDFSPFSSSFLGSARRIDDVSVLVVSVFRDQQRAPEVLNELRRREPQWAEALDKALVLTLDAGGFAKAEISLDLTGCEANSWIRLWSSLLGGALFIHGTHVLIEAADSLTCSKPVDCNNPYFRTGQQLKWWRDSVKLSEDFSRDLAAALSAGGSAIFILFKANRATDVLPGLRIFGETLVHTALSHEQDERLTQFIGALDQPVESLAK
jgi:uncharacterized membrane protein